MAVGSTVPHYIALQLAFLILGLVVPYYIFKKMTEDGKMEEAAADYVLLKDE